MLQSVPTPKLIVISNETRKPLKQSRLQAPTKDSADFRSGLVEEFLRWPKADRRSSRELSANSRKAYTRNLKQFLEWMDKG